MFYEKDLETRIHWIGAPTANAVGADCTTLAFDAQDLLAIRVRRTCSRDLEEERHNTLQLGAIVLIGGFKKTSFDVMRHGTQASPVERRASRHQLGDHRFTLTVILNHSLNAADLPLDSSKSGQDILSLALSIHVVPLSARLRPNVESIGQLIASVKLPIRGASESCRERPLTCWIYLTWTDPMPPSISILMASSAPA